MYVHVGYYFSWWILQCAAQSCIMALGEGRSSGVCCGSSGRASITELCMLSLFLSLSVYVRTCEWIRVAVCVRLSVCRALRETLSGLPQWHVCQGECLWIGRGCCVSLHHQCPRQHRRRQDLFLCSGYSATGQYVPRREWDGKAASFVCACALQKLQTSTTRSVHTTKCKSAQPSTYCIPLNQSNVTAVWFVNISHTVQLMIMH